MNEKTRYGTTLPFKTIDQIKRIAAANRWDDNDVIEVAVENLHASIFSEPNPAISVEQAQAIAGAGK